jgi:peptidoglycan/LPS O-acetylase OafA/YrhL
VGTALHVDPNVLYDATFTRVDALAMGALVATLLREPAWTRAILPRVPRLAMLSGVGLLLVTLASGFLARLNPVTLTLGHTLLAIVSALLVLEVVRRTATEPAGRMIRWLSAPWLRTFGKYSYSIYLIHLPLNLLATRALTPFSDRLTGFVFLGFQLLEVLLGSLLLLGLGWVLHHGVERPFLKLKRFFVVRPAPAREASVLLAPPR